MQSPRAFDIMSASASTSTPSPPLATPSGTSGSRRPPRKSTLTQQQKNQKRQRATQDQLGTLEVEFNKHPTPTAAVRERIAQDINMTERSVQIWFQNRWVIYRSDELFLLTTTTDARRLSYLQKKALRPERTATLFPNRCVST